MTEPTTQDERAQDERAQDERAQDERVRVALVITELNVGGAERCLTQLALGLKRSRFEPLVVSIAPRPRGDQAALVERLESSGITAKFLDAASRWQLGAAIRRLRRVLRQFEPSVVQSFLFHADVLTWLAGGDGRWLRFMGLRVADPARWRQHLERRAARRSAAVVCVSEAVCDYARQSIGLSAERLVVIPNSVDVARYQAASPLDPTRLGLAPGRQMILSVGRLHPQKGLDWLLENISRIFSQLPEHDLVIVGSGPEQGRLRRQAEQAGVASRVHFLGWRPDVEQLMATASMFVLTSRWEGMPNVVLEAMAAGLPLVATQTHGVRELLGANQPQQTVRFGDSNALIERVVAVGRDARLGRQIGSENRARVTDRFSLDAMIAGYQTLYEAHLRRGNGPRR